MRHMTRSKLACRCLALFVVASSFSAAAAQNVSQNESQNKESAQPARQGQTGDLRADLQRQLESIQERQRLVQRALKQLEGGTNSDEIRAQLREAGADRPLRTGQRSGGRDGQRPGGRDGQRPGGRDGRPNARERDDASQEASPRSSRGRQPRDITAEDKAKIIAFIKEQSPTLWERIKDEPGSIDQFVRRFAPRYFAYVDASRRDETLGELVLAEFEAAYRVMRTMSELFRTHRQADPDAAKITERIGSLKGAITVQFDVRLQIQRRELALLKERVARLEADVDSKETSRTQTIEESLERAVKHAQEPRRRRGEGRPGERKPRENGDRDGTPSRRRGG